MENKKLDKSERKYFRLGLTIFISGLALILAAYFINHTKTIGGFFGTLNGILTPFYVGVIVAYLLCPLYNRIVKFYYKQTSDKFKPTTSYKIGKALASFVSVLLIIFIIIAFVMLVLPNIIDSINLLVEQIPIFLDNASNWIEGHINSNPELKDFLVNKLQTMTDDIFNIIQDTVLPGAEAIVTGLSAGIIGTFKALLNFAIGVIICVYILNSKEQFIGQAKKLVLATTEGERTESIFEFGKVCSVTFGGYISGKILDSFIVGVVCTIVMYILGLPMAALIGVIVGVTNIIPFFGPIIGMVPSALLILIYSPVQALEFCIMILILQQIDGNILGPKILGKKTNLSSFWVMFAIIVGGGLFGFLGMILGVPVMAIIYIYCAKHINSRLDKKGLSTKTTDYEDMSKYDIDKEIIFEDKFDE